MAARTIENCSIIKRGIRMGLGEPLRFRPINKCNGYLVRTGGDVCAGCRYRLSEDGRVAVGVRAGGGTNAWELGRICRRIARGQEPGIGRKFDVRTEHGLVHVELAYKTARLEWLDVETVTLHKYRGNFDRAVGVLARLGPDLETIVSKGGKK